MITPNVIFLKRAIDETIDACLKRLQILTGSPQLSIIVYDGADAAHIGSNFEVADLETFMRSMDHPARLLETEAIVEIEGRQIERPPTRRN